MKFRIQIHSHCVEDEGRPLNSAPAALSINMLGRDLSFKMLFFSSKSNAWGFVEVRHAIDERVDREALFTRVFTIDHGLGTPLSV